MGRHAKDGSYGYHTKEAKCPKCRAKLNEKAICDSGTMIYFMLCERKCGFYFKREEVRQ